MYKKAIFIFRRDLRLYDNTALNQACHQSRVVIACFIFDPRQIGDENKFKSERAVQCMIEGLEDLSDQLRAKKGKLYLLYGIAHEVIETLIKQEDIDAVFVNTDYTPFSVKRDKAIEKICKEYDAAFHSYHDVLLHDPESITKSNGTSYGVFTPFYKKSHVQPVSNPMQLVRNHNFYTKALKSEKKDTIKKILLKQYSAQHIKGGRSSGLKILKHLENFKRYVQDRDFPAIATTNLSAYLKFGMLSIREVYHAIKDTLGSHHPLLRQLYWRDFWTYVGYYSPRVYSGAYHEQYNDLDWSNDRHAFKLWSDGNTGFPIVDAGMRQLNQTGFMHNRVRMIVASFLTKDLHINWQWGERYFAQHLIDYDPALNNGNWQWAASTGCDPQPYFRIFNPWLQQKKFDPECEYIKRWVPELASATNKVIHTWYKSCKDYNSHLKYPCPIVDHAQESEFAKKWYKKANKKSKN